MAEHQALLDAILVGRVHRGGAAEAAAALGTFALAQVPPAGARAHDFPAGRNLEPLGHGLLRSDTFWTSHKSYNFLSKRARNIGIVVAGVKSYFCSIPCQSGGTRAPVPLNLHSAFFPLPSPLGGFVGALWWLYGGFGVSISWLSTRIGVALGWLWGAYRLAINTL